MNAQSAAAPDPDSNETTTSTSSLSICSRIASLSLQAPKDLLDGVSEQTRSGSPEDVVSKPCDARRVESRATRRRLANIRLEDCHPQTQSPLFGVLPPEIRNQIFELAVSQYQDMSRPFPDNSFYYRPGHYAPLCLHTELLRTCRLVYYETNAIPMRSATHHHWPNGHAPHSSRKPGYARMTAKNQAELNHVHIFVSPASLKRCMDELTSMVQFQPKLITVTIRRIDWLLTVFAPLRLELDPNWLRHLSLPSSCREFHLELESNLNRKAQLQDIMESVKNVKLTKKDGHLLSIADPEPRVFRWAGKVGYENFLRSPQQHLEDVATFLVYKLLWAERV